MGGMRTKQSNINGSEPASCLARRGFFALINDYARLELNGPVRF